MWWTEEKIDYYERASRYTSFHRELADEIERHVTKDETILELGAGLGHVTEILAKDGYKVRAIEKDPMAVKVANDRIGYPLVEEKDAYEETEGADVVLMVFFGRLQEKDNLDAFMPLAKKRLINISGRHKGYELSKKEDHTAMLPELLREREIPFESHDFESEFNQPLRSIEDAHRWFQMTYRNNEIRNLYEMQDREFPYTFRNRKKTVITVVDTTATKGD